MTREEFEQAEKKVLGQRNALNLFLKAQDFLDQKLETGDGYVLQIRRYKEGHSDSTLYLIDIEMQEAARFILESRKKMLAHLGIEMEANDE